MSAPQIVGFDPEPGFKGYDEEDGLASGMFHYDDGTSRFGQLPAEQVADLLRNKQLPTPEPVPNGPPPAAPSTSQEPLMSEPQTSEAPPNMSVGRPAPPPAAAKPSAAAAAPSPTPYDAFEEQQAQREKAGNPMSIDIPKSSRIAYVHNNPGNLKYAGQEGAQRGEPADDGGHFAAFETPEAGYAALHGQIQHDAKDGMTLGAFITKYAPPSSNDTASYIASASHALGADPNTPISSMNEERLARFMAHAESSTTIGGIAPTSSAPAGGAPGYPRMLGGLPVSQVQERGIPLSPEELQQHQTDIYNRTMSDMATQQQIAQARIQGRQEMQDAQVAQYRQDQQDAFGELKRQEAVKTQAEQNVQREILQPIQKVDPNRYIKDMSVGGRILGIVGMISSAIGNALLHSNGPNGGVQMLLQNIDHDIDSQKDAIANGRAQSQNRIAFWSQRLGSAEAGINAAKLEAKQAVANMLQAKSVGVQNADIRAQMLQASQQILDSGQQEASQLFDKERDRLSITAAVPKPAKPIDQAESLDKTAKLALHMEQLGYKPDEINHVVTTLHPGLGVPGGPSEKAQKSTAEQQKAELAAKKAEEARNAMNEDQGKAEDAMDSIRDLGTKAGLIRDPDTHLWKPGGGLVSPATKEAARNVWGLNPFADKPIRAALSSAAQSYGHFMAGARIDPDKLEIYERLLGSEAATRQQAADALNAAELTVFHRRSAKRQEQPQDASSDGFEATE